MGDKVDNIPGVPGIGPKTATVLVGALGALESIFAAPEAVAGLSLRGAAKLPERLAAHRDAAFLSRELATIATDMPRCTMSLTSVTTTNCCSSVCSTERTTSTASNALATGEGWVIACGPSG